MFTRFSYGKKQLDWLKAHHDELVEKRKKVEATNIEPELEFDIARDCEANNADRERKQKEDEGK